MAHVGSIFAQWLRLVPRHRFERLAEEHHRGAPPRGMSRGKQLVAVAPA